MGKDLKGKELGVGISQRKSDNLYSARFKSKRTGKIIQRYFGKLQECRQWYADATYQDEFGSINANENMTVKAWFDYWLENIKGDTIRYNTRKSYIIQFEQYINPVIGSMKIQKVKPMHCQEVLNRLKDTHRASSIHVSQTMLQGLFSDAVENDVIIKSPVTKAVKWNIGKESKKTRVLTRSEQKLLLESAEGMTSYNQYAFILQTGLRTGEMIGLKWSDIDTHNKVFCVQRTMSYDYKTNEWKSGEPKSKSGRRIVPLTDEALEILRAQKEKLMSTKVREEFADFVFLSDEGEPRKNSNYDSSLAHLCNRIGIDRVSMHTLRHTFATRCIEGGMRPKTLQVLLGHSNLNTTMNLYVHVTDDEKYNEMSRVEAALKVV